MCEKAFFDLYPEEYMDYIPLRFLLCSKLERVFTAGTEYIDGVAHVVRDTAKRHAYCAFNRFAVNWGSAEIDTMGRASKLEFSREINGEFLTYLHSVEPFEQCDEFTTVSSYAYAYLYGERLFERGFLKGGVLVNQNVAQSKLNDFASYLELITIPLEILEAEPAPLASAYDGAPSLVGCLNPKRDVNGLCREKYEILLKYFKDNYGIDTDKWKNPDF